MKYGIVDGTLDPTLPFVSPIQNAAVMREFSRAFLYAIAWRETLRDPVEFPDPCNTISSDGGHGIFQLTSSFPDPGWNSPLTSALYAIDDFLEPATTFCRLRGLSGDALVKVVAGCYNAGDTAEWQAHLEGNADLATTDDYASGVLAFYKRIVATGRPA